jgi:hypothetical protein
MSAEKHTCDIHGGFPLLERQVISVGCLTQLSVIHSKLENVFVDDAGARESMNTHLSLQLWRRNASSFVSQNDR